MWRPNGRTARAIARRQGGGAAYVDDEAAVVAVVIALLVVGAVAIVDLKVTVGADEGLELTHQGEHLHTNHRPRNMSSQ